VRRAVQAFQDGAEKTYGGFLNLMGLTHSSVSKQLHAHSMRGEHHLAERATCACLCGVGSMSISVATPLPPAPHPMQPMTPMATCSIWRCCCAMAQPVRGEGSGQQFMGRGIGLCEVYVCVTDGAVRVVCLPDLMLSVGGRVSGERLVVGTRCLYQATTCIVGSFF
jgi:hypothetical protein